MVGNLPIAKMIGAEILFLSPSLAHVTVTPTVGGILPNIFGLNSLSLGAPYLRVDEWSRKRLTNIRAQVNILGGVLLEAWICEGCSPDGGSAIEKAAASKASAGVEVVKFLAPSILQGFDSFKCAGVLATSIKTCDSKPESGTTSVMAFSFASKSVLPTLVKSLLKIDMPILKILNVAELGMMHSNMPEEITASVAPLQGVFGDKFTGDAYYEPGLHVLGRINFPKKRRDFFNTFMRSFLGDTSISVHGILDAPDWQVCVNMDPQKIGKFTLSNLGVCVGTIDDFRAVHNGELIQDHSTHTEKIKDHEFYEVPTQSKEEIHAHTEVSSPITLSIP
jgi:hypothetical protein